MTVEQIELRKILSQMLADAGINRETLKDLVKEVISEKVEKAVKETLHQTSPDQIDRTVNTQISRYVHDEIDSTVRALIREQVRSTFSRISVTVKLQDPNDQTKSSHTTCI